MVTSASCTGLHGQRTTCLDSYLNVPILKSLLIFTPEALHFFYFALGSTNNVASGAGGKIKLACCVLRRANVPYCPISLTRHNSWFSLKQDFRRAWVIYQGSQSPGGNHQELEACLAWKLCSEGLLAQPVSSHPVIAAPHPALQLKCETTAGHQPSGLGFHHP